MPSSAGARVWEVCTGGAAHLLSDMSSGGVRGALLLYAVSAGALYLLLAGGWLLALAGAALLALPLTGAALTALRHVRHGAARKVAPGNRAVLVTGCDTGFGNLLARRLDKLGFKVFAACLNTDTESVRNLAEECSEQLHVLEMDVTSDVHVDTAVDVVRNNLAGKELWSVVNNAGVAVFTEIEWCPLSEYERIMSVNALGTVRVTKAFLPLLRESQGRLVNVASLAGRFTYPGFSAYSMSKYANIAFSNALRREMKKWKITVCTVEPTLYKTPISAEAPLLRRNEELWSRSPQHVRAVYGEQYFRAFQALLTNVIRTARPDVDEVITCLLEAVASREPRARYVPSVVIQARAQLMALLPETWQDPLLVARAQPHHSRLISTASYSFTNTTHTAGTDTNIGTDTAGTDTNIGTDTAGTDITHTGTDTNIGTDTAGTDTNIGTEGTDTDKNK